MELVGYLTKFTDYMANVKIGIKDLAMVREFMEPFKWDGVEVDRAKLGKATDLLTSCL